jgi:hypothetical protein
MKISYFLPIFFLCSQLALTQDFELENKISNTSIRGWNDWELIISETSLRGKVDYPGDNSFIRLFKINTVEVVSLKSSSDRCYDTTNTYFLEYDTIGLLRKTKQHHCETTYFYDSIGNLITSNTICHALIEVVGDVEILPTVEKKYYSPTFLTRKEFYIKDNRKPYKVFKYFYTKNLLLDKIIINETNIPQKEIIFNYNYFKHN